MNRGSPLPGVDAVQDYGLLLGQVVPTTIKNTLHQNILTKFGFLPKRSSKWSFDLSMEVP